MLLFSIGLNDRLIYVALLHTMNKSIYLSLILLSLLTHARCMAETVTVATGEWPPFFGRKLYKGGYVTEIARQALNRKGYTLEIDFFPWKRAMHLTKSGRYQGLFGCWVNEEFRESYLISKEIMASGDGHFLSPAAADGPIDLRPEDLIGKKVGLVRGYAVSESLGRLFNSGQVIKVEVSQVKQLLEMVRWEGRVDIILENYLVAEYASKKYFPENDFDLKKVGKDYIDGGLYICWSDTGVVTQGMRSDFDDAIGEMRKDGTLLKIMKEFGIEDP